MDIVFVFDDFGTDEALFEVGVNDAGTLRGFPALVVRPCLYFHFTGGDKGFQIQKLVCRLDEAVHTRLFQSHFLQEHLAVFVGFQFGDVGFGLGSYYQDFGVLVLYRLTYLLYVLVACGSTCFVYVAYVHHRFRREQEQVMRYFLFVFRFELYRACRFALLQCLFVAHQYIIGLFSCFVTSGLCLLLYALDTAFDGFQVFQLEFGINDFLVAYRIYRTVYVGHVFIIEATQHVDDGICFADVRQELVAQSFALAGTLHQSGDVYDFYGSRHDASRMD